MQLPRTAFVAALLAVVIVAGAGPARRPKHADEKRPEGDGIKVLIETRGEGGFVIVAPTGGSVHPTGRPYRLRSGDFGSIATIQPDERTALFNLARSFDEMPGGKRSEPRRTSDAAGGDRPGDDFAARTSWADILRPAGWTLVHERGGTAYWRRPDKDGHGTSATVNHLGSGLFYVFSSATDFEPERGYGKFGTYAVLNHGGDFSAAAKDLASQGYGEHEKTPRRQYDESEAHLAHMY